MKALALLLALFFPATPLAHDFTGHPLGEEARWSGTVMVEEPLVVEKGHTLTIAPGTEVRFRLPPEAGGDPAPGLLVRGSIRVEGTPEAPVTFVGLSGAVEAPATPGTRDLLSILAAREASIRHARFTGKGFWGLHVHETAATVTGCDFSNLYGGLRFSAEGLTLENSRFTGNRVAVRVFECAEFRLAGNLFRANLTGLFLRRGITRATVTGNFFDNEEYDVKMGEEQIEDLAAPGNWWRGGAEGAAARIYDGGDDEGLGRVRIDPLLDAPPSIGKEAR